MLIDSKIVEELAILNLAYSVCAAARTAPKACGIDHLETAILTGEDKDKVAAEMRKIGESLGESGRFFCRDADNVDKSGAVVLVGAKYETRGLGERCKLVGLKTVRLVIKQARPVCSQRWTWVSRSVRRFRLSPITVLTTESCLPSDKPPRNLVF